MAFHCILLLLTWSNSCHERLWANSCNIFLKSMVCVRQPEPNKFWLWLLGCCSWAQFYLFIMYSLCHQCCHFYLWQRLSVMFPGLNCPRSNVTFFWFLYWDLFFHWMYSLVLFVSLTFSLATCASSWCSVGWTVFSGQGLSMLHKSMNTLIEHVSSYKGQVFLAVLKVWKWKAWCHSD